MSAGGIICSGSIVYDTLVLPFDEPRWGTTLIVESIECHVGGNGANTSRALARLGTPVRLLGAVGKDPPGEFVLNSLTTDGVDSHAVLLMDAATAATVALVNSRGNRQFLHRLGVSANVFADGIAFTPELCAGMAHYHLASLFILPQVRIHAPSILKNARAAGLTTSLDTNWDALGEWIEPLNACLPELDFLFMNEDEALHVTGSDDPAAGEEILCPAFDVEARDTTGAGDCFVAGFLSAVQRGADLREAGRLGNAVAALSVQKLGAVAGVLPLQQTQAWLETAPVREITTEQV